MVDRNAAIAAEQENGVPETVPPPTHTNNTVVEDDEAVVSSQEEEQITMDDNDNDSEHEEEEEPECRVCRGGQEEDRPLFSPCKCSGSIGLVHQDCLTSWLEVTRGEGRCELCKVKFHFAPQYAEDAPDQLSLGEVLLGLGSRAVVRWLPFTLRLALCVFLWLLVAPLMTSYLYLIWMHRSISMITERFTWNLLPTDTVSGAVLAAVVLVSFLSLMSFADFLRVEWQQMHDNQNNPRADRPDPMDPDGRRRARQELADAAENDRRRRVEVDNELVERFRELRKSNNQQQQEPESDAENTASRDRDSVADSKPSEDQPVEDSTPVPAAVNDVEDNNGDQNEQQQDNDNNIDDDDDDDDDGPRLPQQGERPQPPPQNARPRPNPAPPRQFNAEDFDPLPQDDQMDMEINVALDELLGLRGPITSLLRNLLWLLLFNMVYLGCFAFFPKTIGSVVYSMLLNTTFVDNSIQQLPLLHLEPNTTISLEGIVAKINQESVRVNTIFRVSEFATVNLGYFFCCSVLIGMRFGWILFQRCCLDSTDTTRRAGDEDGRPAAGGNMNHAEREGLGPDRRDLPPLNFEEDPANAGISLAEGIGLILDSAVAIVKVGILLFLKMFLLPVLLGIWLDGSSMELFGSDAEARILYAGNDLFSFILLHWVCGITFMLLVTVSVLQLREVVHPDLLKNVIRPQEPQPNLLGNLMHESVLTQTKRMALSLGIYTALLHLHVAIPVKLLLSSGVSNYLPFLKLKFYHILMPRLQVPIELLVFHLTMLALLEKYKNTIGLMQHHWLKFMSSHMGLTQYMLPQEVDQFALVGHIPVSKVEGEINACLYDLADGKVDCEEIIMTNMDPVKPTRMVRGQTRTDGERVLLTSQTYISLPAPQLLRPQAGASLHDGVVLLPTRLGRFRLKRKANSSSNPQVEVWEEVAGKCIERPPENWDDLAAGDAEVQGRWAWGKEKLSTIENGVARRPHFYGYHGHSGPGLIVLIAKVTVLLVASWCATTLLLLLVFSLPLGFGRLLFSILRVPEDCIHDPLGFLLGSIVCAPVVTFCSSFVMSTDETSTLRKALRWLRRFRPPPARKLGVLAATAASWLVACPLALGLNYELCLLKSPAFFSGKEVLIDLHGLAMSWVVGSVLLNSWAIICSKSVFTKAFWVNFGNGMLEADVEENLRNRQLDAVAIEEDGAGGHKWQGEEGRTGKFFSILRASVVDFEWDRVDRVALLVECAIPVTKNLSITLLVPSFCYLLWFWSMDALVGLDHLSGSNRLYIFRLATASTIFVQLCIAFRAQLQRLVVTLHKTARDDRYLIGEILLNYQREVGE